MARRKQQADEAAETLDRARGVNISRVAFQFPEGFTRVDLGPVLSKDGDTVQGIYKGPGKTRQIRQGRKLRDIGSYKVETVDRGMVEVLGAFQLEQFFVTLKPGVEVFIRRGSQIETKGGRRVTMYDTAVR